MSKRRQRVKVSGATSTWANVTTCIPQGSVLGPLLFVIFINDIEESLSSSYLFADDPELFKIIKNNTNRISLQNDIDKLD